MKTPSNEAAILLVEDDVEQILLLRTLIEQAGPYRVTSAQDGNKGLELLVAGGWALALVDLNLPGADGIEVIQAAKAAHPDSPVMAVTGATSSLMIDGAFRAGADYVMQKPIDRDELLRKIREFVKIESRSPSTTASAGQAATGRGERNAPASHAPPSPTVLAIGARPGDVEMGCGAILFKHRAEGHQVVILNLAGGGNPHSPEAAAASNTAQALGARVTSVGDNDTLDLDAATALLKSVITETHPGMLYLPTASTKRPSSIETNRLALANADSVPNILAYQCPSATLEFQPQFFVDAGPFMDQKNQLLAPYEALRLQNVGVELAEATARFWGRFMDPDLVEPLEVIRRGRA